MIGEQLQLAVQDQIRKVIDILENDNFNDYDATTSFELNNDYYEGKISGREEAIRLLKKGFFKEGEF